MVNKFALIGQEKINRIKAQLSPEQILFAEWLAIPTCERVPKHQRALAVQLGVCDGTLGEWKKIPEIWEVRDSFISTKSKELVPEAVKTIKNLLNSENAKVALDAAKDILDRWAEPRKHASIVASIKDLYEQYNK